MSRETSGRRDRTRHHPQRLFCGLTLIPLLAIPAEVPATGAISRSRTFVFRYASADHFVAFFRRWYGPTHKAFASLSPERQAELAADIAALARLYDRNGGKRLAAAGEYLEVVLDRKSVV